MVEENKDTIIPLENVDTGYEGPVQESEEEKVDPSEPFEEGKLEYVSVALTTGAMLDEILNEKAAEGWELDRDVKLGGGKADLTLIFRRYVY